jgi:pyruvate formate lyase activating enzyme
VNELGRDRLFYEQSGGGVTFSGGEPLLQVEFLAAALQACRQKGLHTAVDTCGYAEWAAFEAVLPYTELFLYDLKLMDTARHAEHTGVPNTLILENIRRLSAEGKPVWVRIPVIPGINDDLENFERTGEFAASLRGVELVELLPYHGSGAAKYAGLDRAYLLQEVSSMKNSSLKNLAELLEGFGLRTKYGGKLP